MTVRTTIPTAFVLILVLTAPSLGQPKRVPACEVELGARPAADLLRDCRAVSLDSRACRPDASCTTLRETIRTTCEEAGADALPACETHIEIDDGEDE